MKTLAAIAVLTLGLGCEEGPESQDRAAATRSTKPDRGKAGGATLALPRCTPFANSALDALVGAEELFFGTGPDLFGDEARLAELAKLLGAAAGEELTSLPDPVRVSLQNDVWGVLQRAWAMEIDSTAREQVVEPATRLFRAAALSPERAEELVEDGIPSAALPYLEEAGHVVERGTELDVLAHEAAFGLRRIFRIFHGKRHRVLFSQLVAIDSEGAPHVTGVVGDLEMLEERNGVVRGRRVLQLDRGALRCHGPAGALAPEQVVHHVPGLGGNHFLVEPDLPVRLSENPCAQCHHSFDRSMALPEVDDAPWERVDRALAIVMAATLADPAAQCAWTSVSGKLCGARIAPPRP